MTWSKYGTCHIVFNKIIIIVYFIKLQLKRGDYSRKTHMRKSLQHTTLLIPGNRCHGIPIPIRPTSEKEINNAIRI